MSPDRSVQTTSGLPIRFVPDLSRQVCSSNPCQTTDNACATIALMNIVMNVPEINLDDRLGGFKANTLRLKPAYRGKKLSECEWMRATHNSFLR